MLKLPLLLPLLLAACAGVEPIPDLELNPVPYRSAISSSLLAGDLDGACLAGDEAAQAIPDDAVAAILGAEAYTAAGRITRAIDCLGRAVEHATDDSTLAHALHNRGVLKMRAADPAGAYQDLEQSAALAGTDLALERDLGAAAYACGDFANARRHWQSLPEAERHQLDAAVGPGFFQSQPQVSGR